MEDNKKIDLEDYCSKLLEINNKSDIFDKVDTNIFIYDIKNTELSNYLTNTILTKLKKIYEENDKSYIVGSFLTQLLFSSIENIYVRKPIKFMKLNMIQSILQDEINERILFNGNTIYFTIKWYKLYKNNEIKKYSLIEINDNIHIPYQYYLIYNYKNKNTLDNVNKQNHNYNQYDIEMIDDEYILRYFFKHMDLSDDFHIRYILSLIHILPIIYLLYFYYYIIYLV